MTEKEKLEIEYKNKLSLLQARCEHTQEKVCSKCGYNKREEQKEVEEEEA